MAVYLVDSVILGVTIDQLTTALPAVIETCQRFSARGEYVRYIRSTYIPGESRCLCLFEAPDAATLEEVNEVAKFPYTRIVEAFYLTAQPWGPICFIPVEGKSPKATGHTRGPGVRDSWDPKLPPRRK